MATTRKAARTRSELTRLWAQALEERDNPVPIAFAVQSDGDDRLHQIDLGTGTNAAIGPAGLGLNERDVEAVAFNPVNTLLYGIDDVTGDLITINTNTGIATRVGSTGVPLNSNPGMSFDSNGNLYVANDNDGQLPNPNNQRGRLYKVNPNNGATTVIGQLGRGLTGLAFDRNNVLFGVDEVNNVLVKVNTVTGATTVVGVTNVFPSFPPFPLVLGTASADIGVSPDIGAGISFDNAGTLWGLDDDRGIFQLNTATGAGTTFGTFGGANALFEDLAIQQFLIIGGGGPPVPPVPLPPPATAVPPTVVPPVVPPVAPPSPPLAVGAGPGFLPKVRVFDNAGNVINEFLAYDANFRGGVTVKSGDVTGDGVPDIVTAPASHGGADIRVFDGVSGSLVASFLAYIPQFDGGASIAIGDVNGDGRNDIITGAGLGGGPHVRVFDGANNFAPLKEFFAYDPQLSCGADVAAADVDQDGKADIVTGNGIGAPFVRVFSGATGAVIRQFVTPNSPYDLGVQVAAGDVTGDGVPDIVAGLGGGYTLVTVLDGRDMSVVASSETYGGFTGGVRVTVRDANGDGKNDIVTGAGKGGGTDVRSFGIVSKSLAGNGPAFLAFPGQNDSGIDVG